MIKSRDDMFDSFKADVNELFFQHQNEVKQLVDMQKNTTEQHQVEVFDSFETEVKELLLKHQNEVKKLLDEQTETREWHQNETELLKESHQNINECPLNPCINNAICVSTPERFFCKCLPGTSGAICERDDIDDCADDPCGNRGTCINKLYDYECQCQLGYRGRNCEENIDDCISNPCSNEGICIDKLNDYKCECKSAYYGKNCQNLCPIDDPKYLLIDGVCLYFEGSYMTFDAAKANCETKFDGNGRLFEPRVYIIGFTYLPTSFIMRASYRVLLCFDKF